MQFSERRVDGAAGACDGTEGHMLKLTSGRERAEHGAWYRVICMLNGYQLMPPPSMPLIGNGAAAGCC